MTLPAVPEGRLRFSEGAVQLQCPGCGCWGDIDDDQLHGRVSVDHTDCMTGPTAAADRHPCTFHETRDWFTTARPWDDPARALTGRAAWDGKGREQADG